jgi:hypothetical protein
MLRLETETGWWLVRHPDHARLAGAFAERGGNDHFPRPERVKGRLFSSAKELQDAFNTAPVETLSVSVAKN